MENEKQNNSIEEMTSAPAPRKDYMLPTSIMISSLVLGGVWVYTLRLKTEVNQGATASQAQANTQITTDTTAAQKEIQSVKLGEQVFPSLGVVLPVTWGDLGLQMVNVGVIDGDKFVELYKQKGAFTDEYRSLLLDKKNGKIKITRENAGYILNLFWALGLGNKNEILENGEMMNPAYGGPQNFASTGGWTIAKGNPMDHYSHHAFVVLTKEQQALVDKVSRGIYRPCCGNSTHFPDCNHGMAMLGLLELMASQGISEQEMWKTALEVNSYWFPNNYLTVAKYMKSKGTDWNNVNPETVLGFDYSSAQGYTKIASQVNAPGRQQGPGCGV